MFNNKVNIRARLVIAITVVAMAFLTYVSKSAWNCIMSTRDMEMRWLKVAQYSLEGMRDALLCYEQRFGDMPISACELFQSGCVIEGTTFEPSFAEAISVLNYDNSKWFRIDQLLVRKQMEDILSADSVVAIVIPDVRYPESCMALLRNWTIVHITKEAWVKDAANMRRMLGDIELW